MKSTTIGVATQTDEYVPTATPTSNANVNPLSPSPPNTNKIKITNNVVSEVINVLLSVELIALLIT